MEQELEERLHREAGLRGRGRKGHGGEELGSTSDCREPLAPCSGLRVQKQQFAKEGKRQRHRTGAEKDLWPPPDWERQTLMTLCADALIPK